MLTKYWHSLLFSWAAARLGWGVGSGRVTGAVVCCWAVTRGWATAGAAVLRADPSNSTLQLCEVPVLHRTQNEDVWGGDPGEEL